MSLTAPVRITSKTTGRWICQSCRLRALNRAHNASSNRTRPSLVTRRFYSRTATVRGAPTAQPNSEDVPKRNYKLPEYPARTRFAPSPTGYLHIGGLRTALFSYLLAKRTGGSFILRIEDTDQKRLISDAEQRICEDLEWAGVLWNEGPDGVNGGGPYGPYRQSERNDIYQEMIKRLLDSEKAYRCFCSPQTAGGAQNPYVTSECYQNCASLSPKESNQHASPGALASGESFTVRLCPPEGPRRRTYPDLIFGNIQRLKRSPSSTQSAAEDGDLASDTSTHTILMKSDGTPTYHFANVVDDHLMKITHVIRGSEWAASAPLHYDIYDAFNWEPPQFAHVGLLVDQNKAKLSKRNSDLALDVASMRDRHGVLPETLCNFLALLGWSNPTENDVMGMNDLISNFDLKFTRGNAMVRMEKLWFLQKSHVSNRCQSAEATRSIKPIEDLIAHIRKEVVATFPQVIFNGELTQHQQLDSGDFNRKECDSAEIQHPDELGAYCAEVLLADSQNYRTAQQFVDRNRYFFTWEPDKVPAEREYYNKAQTIRPEHLRECVRRLIMEFEECAYTDEDWDNNDPGELNYRQGGSRMSKDKQGPLQPSAIEKLESRIQTAITYQVWRLALDPTYLVSVADPPEDLPIPLHKLSAELLAGRYKPSSTPGVHNENGDFVIEPLKGKKNVPLITTPDLKDAEGRFWYPSNPCSPPLHKVGGLPPHYRQALMRSFSVFKGALMGFLRQKLAYGLPGPSMTRVMAVLGRGECRRRLLGE